SRVAGGCAAGWPTDWRVVGRALGLGEDRAGARSHGRTPSAGARRTADERGRAAAAERGTCGANASARAGAGMVGEVLRATGSRPAATPDAVRALVAPKVLLEMARFAPDAGLRFASWR